MNEPWSRGDDGASNDDGSCGVVEGADEVPLEPWEMVEFGRQCKRLIDAGRLAYVTQHLPHLRTAALLTYCDEAVSPENCLLIAA